MHIKFYLYFFNFTFIVQLRSVWQLLLNEYVMLCNTLRLLQVFLAKVKPRVNVGQEEDWLNGGFTEQPPTPFLHI